MSQGVPPVGLRHSQSIKVGPELTVPAFAPHFGQFADMPRVFATAFMVGFIEDTCVAALKPYLEPGQRSVGTAVNVSHTAATPIGRSVTCDVELAAVEGRMLTFKVACRDDKGPIGEGTHGRALIDLAKFEARLAAQG